MYEQLCQNVCLIQAIFGGIYFNEDVFISYLSQDTSENLIAQLYRMQDKTFFEKITTFESVCGSQDRYV